jgi:hypothetical protein
VEVPWDWTAIRVGAAREALDPVKKRLTAAEEHIKLRRGEMESYEREQDELNALFEEINELYEGN